ncbi:MAG: hypothetical protein K0T99_04875 [Alphaproteobacteria bacterium]|nr:hypothetical protein [Alphaproteobacteria bacterium]
MSENLDPTMRALGAFGHTCWMGFAHTVSTRLTSKWDIVQQGYNGYVKTLGPGHKLKDQFLRLKYDPSKEIIFTQYVPQTVFFVISSSFSLGKALGSDDPKVNAKELAEFTLDTSFYLFETVAFNLLTPFAPFPLIPALWGVGSFLASSNQDLADLRESAVEVLCRSGFFGDCGLDDEDQNENQNIDDESKALNTEVCISGNCIDHDIDYGNKDPNAEACVSGDCIDHDN